MIIYPQGSGSFIFEKESGTDTFRVFHGDKSQR